MNNTTSIICTKHRLADCIVADYLLNKLLQQPKTFSHLVFLCIGTPLITGDSLGPMVGSSLNRLHLPCTSILGSLSSPIHACNLSKTWKNAKKKHPDSCFIAVDASFGPHSQLGNIWIENHPLYPGKGVGKSLPPVGDISITGIICPKSNTPYEELNKVAYSDIQTQADIITSGIFQTVFRLLLIRKP